MCGEPLPGVLSSNCQASHANICQYHGFKGDSNLPAVVQTSRQLQDRQSRAVSQVVWEHRVQDSEADTPDLG
jgi:hypothetical protein